MLGSASGPGTTCNGRQPNLRHLLPRIEARSRIFCNQHGTNSGPRSHRINASQHAEIHTSRNTWATRNRPVMPRPRLRTSPYKRGRPPLPNCLCRSFSPTTDCSRNLPRGRGLLPAPRFYSPTDRLADTSTRSTQASKNRYPIAWSPSSDSAEFAWPRISSKSWSVSLRTPERKSRPMYFRSTVEFFTKLSDETVSMSKHLAG